ncbi:hypothetical protein [Trueperella sp. HMSC08B05]|uniref:hypothetical protein n=1 Tax=Trueperella sp. HMSC08B05 TaxID=1581135 RepID=UPI0011D12B0A|nr:hypothetical protein [Trueperella sp. HMSC08B05]
MARPDIAIDAAFATIVVAVIGLVGVIVGQGVQLRLGKQKAVLDEQKTALDKQRLQLDAVNVAVASLTRVVEVQGAEITTLKARVEVTEGENESLEAYVDELIAHINARLPPPPPERPPHFALTPG